MADLKERVCIRFCFLLGKTAAETVTLLREAFKEEALSQARVYEWFSWFKRGDMSLEDQPRYGRPSTSRTDENIKKNSRCYFSLFPRMKRGLKGKCSENAEEVREKMTEALKAITLQEFQNCFEQWKSSGMSVLILKESILRVIKFWKCSEKYMI